MTSPLLNLTPAPLWRHFDMLCQTPRASWHEAAVMRRITDWADEQGLAHTSDEAGNLLLKKPATPGHEAAPVVALQAHVDMVAEAEPHIAHDFTADPIQPRIVEGWVMATDTTLGADNGMGVAAALAVLEDGTITHGPLEVLFTVAEEVSLVGAARLAPNWLSAGYLLNLDTEESGDVCIGCAGGANVGLDEACETAALPGSHRGFRIRVQGLAGGHSGMDIHNGRANANQLLAQLLASLPECDLRLIKIDGGRMDNAITRTASAHVAVAADQAKAVGAAVDRYAREVRASLIEADQNFAVTLEPLEISTPAQSALSAAASDAVIGLLAGLPYGVDRMSEEAPGTVETSNNIGIVQLAQGQLKAQLMVRSLVDTARDQLADRITRQIMSGGFAPTRERGYPGWAPDADSTLLQRFKAVHKTTTGEWPNVMVIHAGLECGLIGAKYPDMEMISFGPTIRGAHSPAERVDIASVDVFYRLLSNTLSALAAG